jgi:hypothetical protein
MKTVFMFLFCVNTHASTAWVNLPQAERDALDNIQTCLDQTIRFDGVNTEESEAQARECIKQFEAFKSKFHHNPICKKSELSKLTHDYVYICKGLK